MIDMSTCQTTARHCEHCGSTDYEDVNLGDQGYSACCNELTVDSSYCRDHHGQDARFQTALDAAVTTAGHPTRRHMIETAGQDAFDALADRVCARVS